MIKEPDGSNVVELAVRLADVLGTNDFEDEFETFTKFWDWFSNMSNTVGFSMQTPPGHVVQAPSTSFGPKDRTCTRGSWANPIKELNEKINTRKREIFFLGREEMFAIQFGRKFE